MNPGSAGLIDRITAALKREGDHLGLYTARARLLLAEKSFDLAVADFQSALRLSSASPDIRTLCVELARALEGEGCSAQSEGVLRDAAGKYPQDAELHLVWAQNLENGGRDHESAATFKRAYALLRRAVANDPGSPQLLLAQAQALGRAKKHAAAERAAQRLLKVAWGSAHPLFRQARLTFAGILMDQGKHRPAEAVLRQALRADPLWEEAIPIYARALLKSGQVKKCLASLDKAKDSPEAAGVRLDAERALGEEFLLATSSGDFASAESIGEQILSLTRNPEVLRVLYSPVDFVKEARDFGPFLKRLANRLAARLRRAPDSLWAAYFNLALSGRTIDAERIHEFLGRLDAAAPGRYDWMRFEVARVLLYFGDLREAASQAQRAAVFCRPAHWPSHCLAGEILALLGESDASAAQFSHAEAAAGPLHHADARAWRGETLLWAGRYKEALAVLDTSVCASARYARTWRGGALVKLGRFEEAVRELDLALAALSLDAEAMLWRCEALLALGRAREAGVDAEAALGIADYATFWFPAVLAASARWALGDHVGAAAAAEGIPTDVIGFVSRRCGLSAPLAPQELPRLLKGLLRLSGGDRRGKHQRILWMPRS